MKSFAVFNIIHILLLFLLKSKDTFPVVTDWWPKDTLTAVLLLVISNDGYLWWWSKPKVRMTTKSICSTQILNVTAKLFIIVMETLLLKKIIIMLTASSSRMWSRTTLRWFLIIWCIRMLRFSGRASWPWWFLIKVIRVSPLPFTPPVLIYLRQKIFFMPKFLYSI